VIDHSIRGKEGIRELQCGVLVVEMMAIINVVKGNRSGCENIKVGRVGCAQSGGKMECVNED
jgi:hypothetical protein